MCHTRQRITAGALSAIAGLVAIGLSATAVASPWTLPQDELTLTMDQHFQHADYEYLPDGTRQSFPLDGTFRAQTLRLGARYGFSDRFEGAMSLNVSNVVYRADPVILEDFDYAPSAGEATEEILDFNSSQFGASDIFFSGRYNLIGGEVMLTTATTAKIPTGYDPPRGTVFTDEQGRERIGGQATLGDGQADIMQSLLFGTVLHPTHTFVRAEAGLNYRFGAPGHQVIGDLRIGQFIGDSIVLIAGAKGTVTPLSGDVIGETLIAEDPYLSAAEFTSDNIRAEDLRLDRDAIDVVAGMLWSLGDVEMTANYYYTPWGRNTAAVHSFTVGTIVAVPDITGK